jgi:hypothetical protein
MARYQAVRLSADETREQTIDLSLGQEGWTRLNDELRSLLEAGE